MRQHQVVPYTTLYYMYRDNEDYNLYNVSSSREVPVSVFQYNEVSTMSWK